MKALFFGGPHGGKKLEWDTSWPNNFVFPVEMDTLGYWVGDADTDVPSFVDHPGRTSLYELDGVRKCVGYYFYVPPRDGRPRLRTSKQQIEQFLLMPPHDLMALPPRVVRDWLLDLQDSIKYAKLVMKYEDYLAARITGDAPPSIDFQEVATWLGDHGDHAGITKVAELAKCPKCDARWCDGVTHLGCDECAKVIQASVGARHTMTIVDDNGAPLPLTREHQIKAAGPVDIVVSRRKAFGSALALNKEVVT